MMGHIMATAAVFDIHIDTNMVTVIRPKFNLSICCKFEYKPRPLRNSKKALHATDWYGFQILRQQTCDARTYLPSNSNE